jgi:PAAR motif
MPSAARAGDQTTHGNMLDPSNGSQNVLIGKRQAWRVIDFATCPQSDGPKPHVGGYVQKASLTVYINGFAAVRMGDTIIEVGPINSVTTGENSVQIGD